MNIRLSLVLLLPIFTFFSEVNAMPPSFSQDTNLKSKTGYVLLSWKVDEETPIKLQSANNPNFDNATTIYQGNNNSFFISGLKNGIYYYRIGKSKNGNWSNMLTLEVIHHSNSKAWLLFTLGAIVFASIVLVIARGEK